MVFINFPPEVLFIERPINFDIFLYIRKSEKLLHYFSNGHQFTADQIKNLKLKGRENLFVLKKDREMLIDYIEFPSKPKSRNDLEIPKTTPVLKSSNDFHPIKITEKHLKEDQFATNWDCVNDEMSSIILEVVNSLNQLSNKTDAYDRIKAILDIANNSSYDTYQLFINNYSKRKGKLPISKVVMLESSISRLFFLSLFFSLKNNVRDKNVVFHSIINILDDKLSSRAREYYNKYRNELSDISGVSLDSLVNIGDAIQYSKQFEAIIEDFKLIFKEQNHNLNENSKSLSYNLGENSKSLSYNSEN